MQLSHHLPGRRYRGTTTEDLRHRGGRNQLLDGAGHELTSGKYRQEVFGFLSPEVKENTFSAYLKCIHLLPMVCHSFQLRCKSLVKLGST